MIYKTNLNEYALYEIKLNSKVLMALDTIHCNGKICLYSISFQST